MQGCSSMTMGPLFPKHPPTADRILVHWHLLEISEQSNIFFWSLHFACSIFEQMSCSFLLNHLRNAVREDLVQLCLKHVNHKRHTEKILGWKHALEIIWSNLLLRTRWHKNWSNLLRAPKSYLAELHFSYCVSHQQMPLNLLAFPTLVVIMVKCNECAFSSIFQVPSVSIKLYQSQCQPIRNSCQWQVKLLYTIFGDDIKTVFQISFNLLILFMSP